MHHQPFFYRDGGNLFKIDPEDIVFLEANKNYVNFICREQVVMIRTTLETAVAQLADHQIVRISRIQAVSLHYVDVVTRDSVKLRWNGTFDVIYNIPYEQIAEETKKQLDDTKPGTNTGPVKDQPSIKFRERSTLLGINKSYYTDLLRRITIIGVVVSQTLKDEEELKAILEEKDQSPEE